MIEHGATCAPDVHTLDERLRATTTQSVGDERRALRGLTGSPLESIERVERDAIDDTAQPMCELIAHAPAPRASSREHDLVRLWNRDGQCGYRFRGALHIGFAGNASRGGL